ncbi:MAG: hypothetical protein Q9168_002076 [Polycauliona sp. 1 TL-2023]
MAKPHISQPLPGIFAHKDPTPWQTFLKSPLLFLTERLDSWRVPVRPVAKPRNPIRVVCISDTHDLQPELPDGDVLLHAGDLTTQGSFDQIQAQLDWLNKQAHRHKIVIAGNHDLLLDDTFDRLGRVARERGRERKDLRWGSVIYLQDESTTLTFPNGRHLKVYGSPWTSQYGKWAFQFPRNRDVFSNTIPPDTDILLTHGPPKYHLDTVKPAGHQGCPHLAKELWRCHDALKLVVFGHIHEGYGKEHLPYDRMQRLRDGIRLGTLGTLALIELVLRIILGHFIVIFSLQQSLASEAPGAGVVLVNAAIATRYWESEAMKAPIVVDI